MDERMRYTSGPWVIVGGALIGALAGYLFATPDGRRRRDAAIRALEDFSVECRSVLVASGRLLHAASDGWNAFDHTTRGSRTEGVH
jgi:hypothetical protein